MPAPFTLSALLRDERGSMAIETAFVAPVLLVMALGGFEVSNMVSRQTELQSAAAEAASVVRAVAPETADERLAVRNIIAASTGLNAETQVTVTPTFRCGTGADYVSTASTCGTGVVNQYIEVYLTDTYEPFWVGWGVSTGFDYHITRTVMIGEA